MFLEGEEEMHFVDEEFLYVRDCPGGLPIELWYLPLLCFLRSSLGERLWQRTDRAAVWSPEWHSRILLGT
jgi:hypothetical protein